MVAMIKYLLQSGQPPGTASPYIYYADDHGHEGQPEPAQLLEPEGPAGRCRQAK